MERAPSLFNLAVQQQRAVAEQGWIGARQRDGQPLGLGAAGAVLEVLGTNRKSSDASAVKQRDPKTANLLTSRARRYRMQREAQQLLPEESVAGCNRRANATSYNGEVSVVQRGEGGSFGYRGVFCCGSVWHCPVCANKIAEQRRAELQAGIAVHNAQGGRVYMMTLTFPHTKQMDLAECLEGLAKSLKVFKASRGYRNMRERTGFKGAVRALETTYGENGWHPHTHELLFLKGDDEQILAELEALRQYWTSAVMKAGLGQCNQHGFTVGNADEAAAYVSKFGDIEPAPRWDTAREMTRQHSKIARKKGRTPFAILFDAMNGDGEAKALFREYAEQFKGKRQLYYTPGLRDALGLGEVSDQDLAEVDEKDKEDEPSIVIWTCNRDEWKLLLQFNMRGEFLDIASKHGTEGCYLFLKALAIRRAGKSLQPNFYYPEHLQ